jgi:hypothetical protein
MTTETSQPSQEQSEPDLFERFDLLPHNVRKLIETHEFCERQTEKTMWDLLDKLEPLGYRFQYYIDCMPFNLRPIE